jgi:hypothetical protein
MTTEAFDCLEHSQGVNLAIVMIAQAGNHSQVNSQPPEFATGQQECLKHGGMLLIDGSEWILRCGRRMAAWSTVEERSDGG